MTTTPPAFLPLNLDHAAVTTSVPAASASAERFADVPALTAALRAGDEEAFRHLHTGWNERVYRYCFVLMRGDGAMAGDVAQAVYLRVARHIRTLPDADALWAWLARAARSAAIDLSRTGGRYGRALERFAEWFGRERRENPADEDATEARSLAALDRVLASLPPEQRHLIELRYFSGHSLDEIAGILALSRRAVEGRLARLRTELRESLQQQLHISDEIERPS